MAVGTGAGWRASLDAIESAIGDCLTALDRYEGTFAGVLTDSGPPPATKPADAPAPGKWDTKLDAARQSADAVERLLAEQEAVWGRWREALAGWQRLAAGGTTARVEARA